METLGAEAIVQISVDAGANYTTIGELLDPSFPINQALHDVTSNSDGRFNTDLKGHMKATLSFTCNYDESDAGQIKMLDAILAGTECLWKWRPLGTSIGINREWLFTGNFSSQEIAAATQGPITFPVSVETSGTITPQTQV